MNFELTVLFHDALSKHVNNDMDVSKVLRILNSIIGEINTFDTSTHDIEIQGLNLVNVPKRAYNAIVLGVKVLYMEMEDMKPIKATVTLAHYEMNKLKHRDTDTPPNLIDCYLKHIHIKPDSTQSQIHQSNNSTYPYLAHKFVPIRGLEKY